jgi:hypothetical protein
MDSQGVPWWYKFALLVALVIAVIFLVMAYYLPDNELWYEILTFSLLAASLIIVSGISLINFMKKTDTIYTFEEMIIDKLGAYFDKINEKEYISRGLEWFLVPGHYWLELRINKKTNNFVKETTTNNNVYTTNMDTNENRLSTHQRLNKNEESKIEKHIDKSLSIPEGNLDDSD